MIISCRSLQVEGLADWPSCQAAAKSSHFPFSQARVRSYQRKRSFASKQTRLCMSGSACGGQKADCENTVCKYLLVLAYKGTTYHGVCCDCCTEFPSCFQLSELEGLSCRFPSTATKSCWPRATRISHCPSCAGEVITKGQSLGLLQAEHARPMIEWAQACYAAHQASKRSLLVDTEAASAASASTTASHLVSVHQLTGKHQLSNSTCAPLTAK